MTELYHFTVRSRSSATFCVLLGFQDALTTMCAVIYNLRRDSSSVDKKAPSISNRIRSWFEYKNAPLDFFKSKSIFLQIAGR